MERLIIFVLILFCGCAGTGIADIVVGGTMDRAIGSSPVIKSKAQRIQNNESSIHELRRDIQLYQESYNYVNKIIDRRLAGIETELVEIKSLLLTMKKVGGNMELDMAARFALLKKEDFRWQK